MITLLPADFKPLVVTRSDLAVASIAWGFTLGFGFLTVWTALSQTIRIRGKYGYSKLNSPYVWMIWLEITVCFVFSVICWLYIWGLIPSSFAFFFSILTLWALQVQFLLQIIINRVAIILVNKRKALYLKIGVAVLITCINISVYNIWVPARLQISQQYIDINDVWDRCEKCIYLVVDGCLNWYFIRIVKKRLVRQGLTKYDQLVKFNMWIIAFSLSMDCLIIGMMSLKNTFVYMQFHPLAYIVKLNIEMSMANLIAKVSAGGPHDKAVAPIPGVSYPMKNRRLTASSNSSRDFQSKEVDWRTNEVFAPANDVVMHDMFDDSPQEDIAVVMKTEVQTYVERRNSATDSKESSSGFVSRDPVGSGDEDMAPLKEIVKEINAEESKRSGVEKGMGVYTKVWGP